MPYVQDQDQQNQQNQQPGQVPPTTSSAPGAGPGAGAAGAGKAATPQSAPAQPFQNLQAYLGANQPQVQQQADSISSGLNNQYGQTTAAIDQGQKDFGTQVAGGYAAPNQDLVNQAASNPTQFASDPNNVKAFQSLYNDSYTGPSNFESTDAYGNLNANVNKAVSDASLLGSNEGLQTYFQGQNPNATKGGNILDSVLLQGSPQAYAQVQNAAKPFSTLNDYLNTSVTNADQGVAAAQKTASDTAAAAQSPFIGANGIIPTFQNDINSRVADQSGKATNELNAMNKLIAGGNLTSDELAMLGMNQGQFNTINTLKNNAEKLDPYYKYSAQPYFSSTPNPGAVTSSTAANPEDFAKADALAKLTGQPSLLNGGEANLSGTAPIDTTFNSQAAMSALNDIINRFSPNPNPRTDVIATSNPGTLTPSPLPPLSTDPVDVTTNPQAPSQNQQSAEADKLAQTIADEKFKNSGAGIGNSVYRTSNNGLF